METKEEYLEFIKDLEKVTDWVADNIDTKSATIIITWLIKMSKKLQHNLEALLEIKEMEKAKEENIYEKTDKPSELFDFAYENDVDPSLLNKE